MSATGTINERKVRARHTTTERGRGVKRREVNFTNQSNEVSLFIRIVGGSLIKIFMHHVYELQKVLI